MKETIVDDRISVWVNFRHDLEFSNDPLQEIAEFWGDIRLIPFNKSVDPYNSNSWPTPWQIIADDQYDELTLAIMIGYTVKLTERFKNTKVEIRTLVDSARTRLYNLIYVDEQFVLNYERNTVVNTQDIPDSFFLENFVELSRPR